MKTRLLTLLAGLMLIAITPLYADQTVTVTATDGEISEALDLKAVATIFGESKDLEEFEHNINDPEKRISNLDLNGDGQVDYLRVIETADQDNHLVVLQAVLAKDIYQDVASIFVQKDKASKSVTVQIVGDEYIYGANYVVEPVFLYTPVIYSYFWAAHWSAYYSPYYWGYYPHWWHTYYCWTPYDYWNHIYAFHHHHPYCSYRHRPAPPPHYHDMPRPHSRRDFATRHPEGSFSQRNSGRAINARDVQASRVRSANIATRSGAATATRIATNASRTFNSANVRSGATTVTRSNSSATTTRSSATSRSTATAVTRSSATPTRTSATPARSSSTSVSRSTNTSVRSSATSSRSSSSVSRSSATPSRSSSSNVSRSSGSVSRSSATPSRSSSGSVSRSSGAPTRSSAGSRR